MQPMERNVSDRIEGLLGAAIAASGYEALDRKMTLPQVRQWAEFNRTRRGWIRAEVPQPEATELSEALSPVLERFTNPETGHVGFAPYDVIGGELLDVTVNRLVADMVASAAMLGPKRVVSAVLAWAEGAPGSYVRTCVLRGIELPEPLAHPDVGIRFEKLPDRSSDLEQYCSEAGPFLNATDLMNQPVLRFDVSVKPMFYLPNADEGARDRMTRIRNNAIVAPALQDFDLNNLLDALSLVCRSSVQSIYEWDEYSDEMLLMRYAGSPGFMRRNVPRFHSRWPDSIPLGPELLADAMTVIAQMDGRSDLHVAVSRWKNSGVALDAANRMIDLRTVLECLYARDANQELAFRTALCGAMHLAPTAAERTVYYSKLLAFYRKASSVVHGGKQADDEDLVKWCYETCRRAILKRLGEPQELDRTALMLGLHQPTSEGPRP